MSMLRNMGQDSLDGGGRVASESLFANCLLSSHLIPVRGCSNSFPCLVHNGFPLVVEFVAHCGEDFPHSTLDFVGNENIILLGVSESSCAFVVFQNR